MTTNLKETINQDLKQSMKSGDALRVSTLRLLIAAIKNKEIELLKPVDNEGVCALIQKLIKQRKESIEQFTKGNRKDLAEKEQKEIDILKAYLPAAMSSEDVEKKVQLAIQKTNASSLKEMGVVMKHLQAELSGQADMQEVSRLVREKLSK